MGQCYFCGGQLESRLVEHVGRWGHNGRPVIVKDVPAAVCTQCGEEYYAPEVAHVLDRLVRGVGNGESEAVAVLRFPQGRREEAAARP